ncbi:MAG: hypothetical protein BA863_10445 [Desulfovibrio sp. S3730MH75]|nr:MAG: hypothetical protein BA863_10445 [Desulfovibrio sp. S3730MH75]
MTFFQLSEAITKIQAHGIKTEEMVILAPVGTLGGLDLYEHLYLTNGKRASCAPRLYFQAPGMLSNFNGVLVVEDQMHTKVVVKSLISEHRVEVL